MTVESSAPHRSFLDAMCAWLALAVPLVVTLWRLAPESSWTGDLQTVRALERLPVFGSGALSSWLAQPLLLLPVGGRAFRVAIVDALAVGVAAKGTYILASEWLSRNATTPRLTPLLALAGAWLAGLSPAWQCHGTVAGGGSVAAALVLGLIAVGLLGRLSDARYCALAGVFIALVFLESLTAGAIASTLVGVELASHRERRRVEPILALCGAMAIGGLLYLGPTLLGPAEPREWLGLGDVIPGTLASDGGAILRRCVADQGILATSMGAIGALVLVGSPPLRRNAIPWLLIVAAASAFDGRSPLPRAQELDTLLMLLTVAGVAVLAPLGVQSLALGLVRLKVPLAEPASALLVACFLSLAFVNGEDSERAVDRQRAPATQLWTEEALASLPKGAVLLAGSPDVVWRIWAARAASGERDDLVLVPTPLLEQGAIAASLLQREPALTQLMRDLAVKGRATEFSLSSLADARTLFVDVGVDWDRRLLEHLVPRSMWLEFAPHALGRSDRVKALKEGRGAFERVLSRASDRLDRDPLTLRVLAQRAKERAVVHAALGDREALQIELQDLETMDLERDFVREVRRRLQGRSRGAIDVGGLLVCGTKPGQTVQG